MKLAQLQAERRTLVERASALIDGADPVDDEALQTIRYEVEALDDTIRTVEKVGVWEVEMRKRSTPDRADTNRSRDMRDFSILKAVRAAWGRSLPGDDSGVRAGGTAAATGHGRGPDV